MKNNDANNTQPMGVNIATPMEGAVILASSFENTREFYPDNLIGGIDRATWRSTDSTEPQWIELRWPFPRKMSSLEFLDQGTRPIAQCEASAWINQTWVVLAKANDPTPTNDNKRKRVDLGHITTDRLRLILDGQSGGGGYMELAALKVYETLTANPSSDDDKSCAGRTSLSIESVFLPDKPLEAGQWFECRARIRTQKKLHPSYAFLLILGERALDAKNDFILTKTIGEPSTPIEEWKPFEFYEIKWTLQIPEGSPGGSLTATCLHGTTSNLLSFEQNSRKGETHSFKLGDITIFDRKPTSAQKKPVAKGCQPISCGIKAESPLPPPFLLWRTYSNTFRKFAAYSGTGVQTFLIDLPGCIAPDNQYADRLKMLDQSVDCLLRTCPDARVIVYYTLKAWGGKYWAAQYPDDTLITAFGEKTQIPCFASKRYEEACLLFTKQLIQHVKSASYRDRVIGYIPYTNGTPDSGLGGTDKNEWQPDRNKLTIGDWNPQTLGAFEEWLRRKYHHDEIELKNSWKDPRATFASARPDREKLLMAAPEGTVFRDPKREGNMAFDYFDFLMELLPGVYEKIARQIKEETGNKALVGIHYGYVYAGLRAGYQSPAFGLQNNSFYLPQMLKNKHIDFYSGASCYWHRSPGNSLVLFHPASAITSNQRHFIMDGDYRTFLAHDKVFGRLRSAKETLAVMKRDMAISMIRKTGMWLGEWSSGSSGTRSGIGWYDDPDILNLVKQTHKIHASNTGDPGKNICEVAVILSCKSYFYGDVYLAPPIYHNLVGRIIYEELPKIGCPYDVLFIENLRQEAIAKKYKLYIILNGFILSRQDKENLEILKGNGKTILWFYAPNYIDSEQGLRTKNIEQITGIAVKERRAPDDFSYSTTSNAHPITTGLAADEQHKMEGYGNKRTDGLNPLTLKPAFCVDDPSAATLAEHTDHSSALAVKKIGDWNSVYCAIPYMNSKLLRNIARFAGVHIFSADDIILDANSRFLMLHNGYEPGKKVRLNLPGTYDAKELYSEKTAASHATQLNLEMPACETYFYEIEKKD
ncbi:MAG: hypothetical protein PHV34_13640 [Verrucomicrobiae bacterium]|nr:hypothetical protein [Verrucomicrobiae bacterium]